ncbi:MAG: phospholipid carrier-dependent glycosyltransferase [Candidatus Paceibacterota bacterium]|jgi:dolichyl-phosphate-mannose--protein O-mannosyl transferase
MHVSLSRTWIFVSLLLGISFILHFWRIDIPNKPVFDENSFSTYAADYTNKIAFFDIHPPLGKVVYAIPLFFTNKENLNNSDFLKQTKESIRASTLVTFNTFPYQLLRAISALFGLLLVSSVFFFLRSLTRNNTIALIGMFFMVFESALLLETRLILLNGMFLAFGFLALGFLYKEKPNFTLTGIFLGLALSIKLVAIVFLGPILFYFFSKRFSSSKKSFVYICLLSFFLFVFLWIFLSNILLPTGERLAFYNSSSKESMFGIDTNNFFFSFQSLPTIKAFFIELSATVSGYTTGKFHVVQSSWYLWPFMIVPFTYFHDTIIDLILLGNPFVWMLGTLSVIFSLCVLALKRFRIWVTGNITKSVLLVGYFSSLLPFALLHRSTFLYHYFPALIFSICLAAVYIYEHFETLDTKRKKRVLALVVGGVLLGFAFAAPFIYAF